MKKMFRLVSIVLFVYLSAMLCLSGFADPPDPPPLPGGHGQTGNVAAPIDGGMGILLVLGHAYAGKKIYQRRKDDRETE